MAGLCVVSLVCCVVCGCVCCVVLCGCVCVLCCVGGLWVAGCVCCVVCLVCVCVALRCVVCVELFMFGKIKNNGVRLLDRLQT